MPKYIFCNINGCFVYDEQQILDRRLFKGVASDKEIANAQKNLLSKHNDAKVVELPDERFFQLIRKEKLDLVWFGIEKAKVAVREAFRKDIFIMQTINNVEELDTQINLLSKRLREWYGYYCPEAAKQVQDNESFVRLVIGSTRDTILKKLNVPDTMGCAITDNDLTPIMNLAGQIDGLIKLRSSHLDYLDELMDNVTPNLKAVTGASIGAKLIVGAGSIEKLAKYPSSTIQTLGAEKAMFRHLKTGSRPPKYGYILQHPLVAQAARDNKGKAARTLAAKIAIAVRIDFFGGESYRGYEIKEELEKKLKKM